MRPAATLYRLHDGNNGALLARQMTTARSAGGRSAFIGTDARKGPHRQRGATGRALTRVLRAGACIWGMSHLQYMPTLTAGKVTYESEPSEIGQNASNLSRAKSDQRSASEAAFVVTCPEIPSARTKGEACPVAPFSSQSTTFPDKNGSARSQRTVAAGGCCWRSRAMPFQSAPDGGRRVWEGVDGSPSSAADLDAQARRGRPRRDVHPPRWRPPSVCLQWSMRTEGSLSHS